MSEFSNNDIDNSEMNVNTSGNTKSSESAGGGGNTNSNINTPPARRSLRPGGGLGVVKKLNAVKLLTKNTDPKRSKIYSKDLRYVQKKET